MTAFENPLVSVIVPIYNVESYLDECLNSIKMQTHDNLEIIVIEDCSTDNSMQVLQSHLKDTRIKIIKHLKNEGVSSARNAGIDMATGVYIMFVDSDDIIDVRLIAACVNCATTTKADLITYGYVPFPDGMNRTKLPYPPSNLALIPYKQGNEYFAFDHYCWVKFIRFSVLRESKIRFPEGFYYEDGPFHWHIGLELKNRYHLPVNFYLYRKHSKSITALSRENSLKLLDNFTMQLEMVDLVQRYKADELKSVLADQLTESNFYNLLYIDFEFLAPALSIIKKVERAMRENDYKRNFDYRYVTVSALALAPSFVSLSALKVIHMGLHKAVLPSYKSIRKALKSVQNKE